MLCGMVRVRRSAVSESREEVGWEGEGEDEIDPEEMGSLAAAAVAPRWGIEKPLGRVDAIANSVERVESQSPRFC
jgi:hypothetical protein